MLPCCFVCILIMLRPEADSGIIDSNPTEIGGFKEIVFEIEGRVLIAVKFESVPFSEYPQLNPVEEYILPLRL